MESQNENALVAQRGVLEGRLRKAALGLFAILGIVVLLAGIGLWMAAVSNRHLEAALEASDKARTQLWQSYLAQARAERASRTLGARGRGLEALAQAARIRHEAPLTRELTDLLALTDLNEPEAIFQAPHGAIGIERDETLERLAVRFEDGHVEVRNMSNALLWATSVQPGSAAHTAFSADGRYLAVRHQGGWLRVWDLQERQLLFESLLDAANNQGTFALAFSRNNRFVAAGEFGKKGVSLFDLMDRKRVAFLPIGPVELIAFTRLGEERMLTLGRDDSEIAVWTVAGEKVRSYQHTSVLSSFALSRDEETLVAGSIGGEVIIWKMGVERPRVLRAHTSFVTVHVNPTGTLVASSAWDGLTKLWCAASGQQILATESGVNPHFSANGERLGFTFGSGGAGYWRVAASRHFATVSPVGEGRRIIFAVDFSADNRLLGAYREDGLHFYDAQTRKQRGHLKLAFQWGQSFAFLSSNEMAIATIQGVQRWRIEEQLDGALNFALLETTPPPKGFETVGVEIALATPLGVTSLNGYHLMIFNRTNAAYRNYLTNFPSIRSFSIDPKGERMAVSARNEGYTCVIDIASEKAIHRFTNGSANVEFSADGRWLAIADNSEVRIYDGQTLALARSVPRRFAAQSSGVFAMSASGRWLAFHSADGELSLLNLNSGIVEHQFRRSNLGSINTIAFSPDETLLAAGTQSDDWLHVWNLTTLSNEVQAFLVAHPVSPLVAQHAQSSGSTLFSRILLTTLTLLAVTVALGIGIVQRQRQLLRAYLRTEDLMRATDERLQRANAEILHTQKMTALGTLAAGIAHDFNNILSVIRMSNDLIAEARTKAEALDSSREIEEAVAQGREVVRSMLGYVREDRASPEAYDLTAVIERLLRMLKKEFLRGMAVRCDWPADLPQAFGSRTRLEQIILNLLINAGEAMSGAGTLTISAEVIEGNLPLCKLEPAPRAHYLRLILQDSGPGISPENLQRIFEPFFSTKASGAARGRGLGLSLVYTLAQKEGIGLAVESASGAGATFQLFIPTAAAPIAPAVKATHTFST